MIPEWDDRGWDQSAASRGAEKRLGSGYVSMVEPAEFADGLVEE